MDVMCQETVYKFKFLKSDHVGDHGNPRNVLNSVRSARAFSSDATVKLIVRLEAMRYCVLA